MSNMDKKPLIYKLWIVLVFIALPLAIFYIWDTCAHTFYMPACRSVATFFVRWMPDRVIPPPPVTVLPTVAIPTGVDPGALAFSGGYGVDMLPPEAQGGSISFVGTWASRASEDDSLFWVAEDSPFVGEFLHVGLNLERVTALFACFVDYRQTPCKPDASLTQIISPMPDRFSMPIEIHNLDKGLHDLVMLFWLDPFADHDDPESDARVQFMVNGLRASLAVEGITQPPEISYPEWSENPRSALGIDGVMLSDTEYPISEYGGIQYTTHLQGKVGEPLEFYLHLNNRGSYGLDYALLALLDYQQIPLIWQDEAYMPLYAHVKARAWEVSAVQIIPPLTPGHYELQIIGIMLPYARMDQAGPTYYYKFIDSALQVEFQTTTRIYLDIRGSSEQ